MESINDRIIRLIDDECSGNKSAFARKVNITPAYAAQLYKNERTPSDRTISDICRIFDIQEDWLRYGFEPKKAPKSKEEEIAELVGSALSGSSAFKKSVIRMICSRTDKELEALEKALSDIYENIKKEDRQN